MKLLVNGDVTVDPCSCRNPASTEHWAYADIVTAMGRKLVDADRIEFLPDVLAAPHQRHPRPGEGY